MPFGEEDTPPERYQRLVLSLRPNVASKAWEMKVSTSTVAALFSKMALKGQRLAMVDMVLHLFFQQFQKFLKYLSKAFLKKLSIGAGKVKNSKIPKNQKTK